MLVTFKVTLPENTPADAEIYIAGNFAAHTDLPDWAEAGAKATRSGNIAEITIPFAITSAITLEYKWTRGSWATVESAADQINDISNRSVSIDPANSDLVINDDILGWKDAPGGEELDEAVDVSVTFVLTVPENTPMDEDIYIVGEINKISDDYPNWDS